jgi:hypothetical protein
VTTLAYSTCACAAIFDLNQPVSGAIKADAGRLSGIPGAAPYRTAGITHAHALQFPSLHPRIASSQDLLWMVIGDATRPTLFVPTLNGDKPMTSAQADVLRLQNATSSAPAGAPVERTAPGIWALFLIGAGLVWSHLRRKGRHQSIRFTGS